MNGRRVVQWALRGLGVLLNVALLAFLAFAGWQVSQLKPYQMARLQTTGLIPDILGVLGLGLTACILEMLALLGPRHLRAGRAGVAMIVSSVVLGVCATTGAFATVSVFLVPRWVVLWVVGLFAAPTVSTAVALATSREPSTPRR